MFEPIADIAQFLWTVDVETGFCVPRAAHFAHCRPAAPAAQLQPRPALRGRNSEETRVAEFGALPGSCTYPARRAKYAKDRPDRLGDRATIVEPDTLYRRPSAPVWRT